MDQELFYRVGDLKDEDDRKSFSDVLRDNVDKKSKSGSKNAKEDISFSKVKDSVSYKKPYFGEDRVRVVNQKLRELETQRKGLESYFELRGQWSRFLRRLLSIMVLFQFLVTAAIGLKLVDFSEYRTFLYAILIENFLQIVGMAIIVVTFLFPKSSPSKEFSDLVRGERSSFSEFDSSFSNSKIQRPNTGIRPERPLP